MHGWAGVSVMDFNAFWNRATTSLNVAAGTAISAADTAYSEATKLAMQAKLNTEISLLQERHQSIKRRVSLLPPTGADDASAPIGHLCARCFAHPTSVRVFYSGDLLPSICMVLVIWRLWQGCINRPRQRLTTCWPSSSKRYSERACSR